jgi:predicted nucleotidyltransferase
MLEPLDTPDFIAAIKHFEVARLCAAHAEVRLMVAFGSAVRGQARADSDLDIGVLGGSLWEQLAVGTELGRVVHREPHVMDLATASEWLCFQVARDGVLIFEREPSTWIEFKAQAMIRYWDVAPIIELTAQGVRRRLAREAQERNHG